MVIVLEIEVLQHLLRHREILKDINFFTALKNMLKGSRDYINKYKNKKSSVQEI